MPKFSLGICIFLSLLFFKAKATHIVGADLTAECQGGNSYKITLHFYRDCEGVEPNLNPVVTVKSDNCNFSKDITLDLVSQTDISAVCSSLKTTCEGGTYPGVQEYVFEKTYKLPQQCDDWKFYYNESGSFRNAAITNIFNPTSTEMYIESSLDNKNVSCDNLPHFSNPPYPFICMGEEYCFNPGAIDDDGDSLVYSLVCPKSLPGANVIYMPGFTYINPLTTSTPLAINSATGDICLTAKKVEISVMAVKITEYRNGKEIGYVIRDIQLTVVDCGNTLPYVDGINKTDEYEIDMVANCQYCFDVYSYDDDASDNVSMSWNNGIAGATFSVASGSRPKGSFCWTAPSSSVSSNPYLFTVEVKDDACPYVGSQVFSFSVFVTDALDVSLTGPSSDIPCGSTADIIATANGGSGNFSYEWDTNPVETASKINVYSGTYTLTLTDKDLGCSVQEAYTVTESKINPDFSFTNVCEGNENNFTDLSTLALSKITSWEWQYGDIQQGSSYIQNSSYLYDSWGTYPVSLIVGSEFGCIDTITKNIEVYAVPITDFSATDVCFNAINYFNDATTLANGNISSWDWNIGDKYNATTQNPSYTFNQVGSYNITLVTFSNNGCSDTLTKTINVYDNPSANFTFDKVCLNDTTTFTDQSTMPNGQPGNWQWDFGDVVSAGSTNTSPTYVYTTPGMHDVQLIVASDKGCIDTISNQVEVYYLPEINFSALPIEGCMPLEVNFTDASTIGNGSVINWLWKTDGLALSDQNPIHTYSHDGTYDVSLTAFSDHGCVSSLMQNDFILVHPKPIANFSFEPQPTSIFFPFIEFENSSEGSVSWSWDFGDETTDNSENPKHTYPDSGYYNAQLISYTEFGCSDTSLQTVIIDPDFSIYTPNTFTPNGDGKNDNFSASGYGIIDYQMNIYDRWGNEIFSSSNSQQKWNGKDKKGNIVKIDTYVYDLHVTDVFNKKHHQVGNINVVR